MTILNIALPSLAAVAFLLVARPAPQLRAIRVRVRKR